MTTSRSETPAVPKLRPALAAVLALAAAAPGGAEEVQLTSAGLPWVVAYADYSGIDGNWALDIGLAARESFHFDEVPFEAFCSDILAAMPGAPGGLAADSLYRVSINILSNTGPAFPNAIPLAVEDGQCRMVVKEDGTFIFPNPPPLRNWWLDDLTIPEQGGAATALFRPIPGAEADPGSFPVDFACRMVLAEKFPPIRDALHQLRPVSLEVKGEFASEPAEGVTGTIAVGSTFAVADGTCQRPDGDSQ